MGSLYNVVDFGVFWASWGGSGKEPGCVPEVSFFFGSDGLGSAPEVWTEPVLGTGFREPGGIKKVPGSGFRRFRSQGSES